MLTGPQSQETSAHCTKTFFSKHSAVLHNNRERAPNASSIPAEICFVCCRSKPEESRQGHNFKEWPFSVLVKLYSVRNTQQKGAWYFVILSSVQFFLLSGNLREMTLINDHFVLFQYGVKWFKLFTRNKPAIGHKLARRTIKCLVCSLFFEAQKVHPSISWTQQWEDWPLTVSSPTHKESTFYINNEYSSYY